MKLEYIPLLQIQRDLYDIPRGMKRFESYLNTMVDSEAADLKLPLVPMNPMGKAHVPALLDEYLGLGADELAQKAVNQAADRLVDVPGEFKVTLVITDDAMGQWTNRYTTEFGHRFETRAFDKRGWFVALLWTSETPSAYDMEKEVLMTVFRGAYIQHYGYAKTLQEMLRQEGYAMTMAGCQEPRLDAEELSYTQEVLEPYLATTDYGVIIAALFGDEAAHSLGYQPLGLSTRAGFALALQEAQHSSVAV